MLGNDVWLLPVFEVFLWTELNTAHDRVGHSTAIFFFFFFLIYPEAWNVL